MAPGGIRSLATVTAPRILRATHIVPYAGKEHIPMTPGADGPFNGSLEVPIVP